MATVYVQDAVNAFVEQTLSPAIDKATRSMSRCYRKIMPDSQSVKGNWGQGWVITGIIQEGLAGVFKYAKMSPSAMWLPGTDTGSNPNFQIAGLSAAEWDLDPEIAGMPNWSQWTQGLSKVKGLLTFPAELRRVCAMTGAYGDVLAAELEGAAHYAGLIGCNALFAETSTLTTATTAYVATFEGCVIGEFDPGAGDATVTGIGSGTTDTTSAYTLTKGSIRRFEDGVDVDLIGCVTGTDRIARLNPANEPLKVNLADPFANTLRFVNAGTSTVAIPANTVGGATTNYILIVPHGALDNQSWSSTAAGGYVTLTAATTYTSLLPFGIERYYKNTGGIGGTSASHLSSTTSTGSISLSQHPRFKSYVHTGIGAALDETTLFQDFARAEYAGYTEEDYPEVFWTTPGVYAAMTEVFGGMTVIERNGQPLNMSLGVSNNPNEDGIPINLFGKVYRIMTDPFIGGGKLYGTKISNSNWKKHMPPKLEGTGGAPGWASGIEFDVPLQFPNAGGDIWAAAISDGGTDALGGTLPTARRGNLLICPFKIPYQVRPDKVRGVLMSDITESYGPTS